MKSIKMRYISLIAAVVLIGNVYAQEEKTYQMYAVHEDVVMPSMVMEYEAVAKEFKTVMDQYKDEVADLAYLCATTDDLRYMFVWPIENMAELDKNPIGEVRQKMGAEKFDDMMARMDKCYSSHTTYTITMDKNLTYMPEGVTQTPEGENYREYYYYYTTPSNASKLAKKGKAIKEHHEKVGSDASYRIYRSGFGSPESYFMVAVSAKDPADMAKKQQDNNAKLGQEYQQLLNDAMKYTSKFRKYTGWIRNDLSVTESIATKKK